MKKSTTFIYEYMGGVYVNLTNRCCCDCNFCIRNAGEGLGGEVLWLAHEPSADEVIAQLKAMGNLASIPEIVFCGYGEPTYRLDVLLAVAFFGKNNGIKTRLNTNGLANLIHNRNIILELKNVIDVVSISLNDSSPDRYNDLCRPQFGLAAYPEILDFTAKCIAENMHTILSVVNVIPPQEIQKCQQIAHSLGAAFRVREI